MEALTEQEHMARAMLMGYTAAHCRPFEGEGVLYYRCDPGGVPYTNDTLDGETLKPLRTVLFDGKLGLVAAEYNLWALWGFKRDRKWLFHYDQQTKMWVPGWPDEGNPGR